MLKSDLIANWPGKSPAGQYVIAHPAIYHMLDAAAVAEVLVSRWEISNPLRDALTLFAGIHDLGKIGRPFRDMLTIGQPQTNGSHWEVTEAYLRDFDPDLLALNLGASEDTRFELYAACAGHHGRPPRRDLLKGRRGGTPAGDWAKMLDAAGQDGLEAARSTVEAFLHLWPKASLEGLSPADAKKLSWRLAGLATAADWIASNVEWFEPTRPGPDPERYLECARSHAHNAVKAAGLVPPEISNAPLFDFSLRPMQAACSATDLPEGPVLAIIEDETGSGKTEAAMILAQRLLGAGKASGFYLALPTMATADAMFARIVELLPRLFVGEPSVALAHGRAGLSQHWRELRDARAYNPDEPGAHDWVADNRRRALLATLGVGTIDQALMAVLRAKHAALRQHGLASKLLIVDEVHEMGDPYMGQLLEQLLELHAANGGSAILLSATIPLGLRQQLSNAFERGGGRSETQLDKPDYPALTISQAGSRPIPQTPPSRGATKVCRIATAETAIGLLSEAARKGAACVWVRNAVDEAIAAVDALRAKGVEADLLHARFALVDRKKHEAEALKTFGKNRVNRPGRVLVATQVVESSLDLDFDVMVSDLAPMAALVQRAGRLWRHMNLRPADRRPVSEPVLHVFSPDPDDVTSGHWLHETLGQGAFVYPAALQWRTAKVLFESGRIDAPFGLRALVEAAHGDEFPVPEVLAQAEIEALGKDGAARNLAFQNQIDWHKGYRAGANGADDSDYPTRLGLPQLPLILARRTGQQLLPWSGEVWSVEACQMSEVQASKARLSRLTLPDQDAPEIRAAFKDLPDWIGRTRRMCPIGAGGEISNNLRYCSRLGLVPFSDLG